MTALRRAGASVCSLHMVGDGVPDLMVGYRGKTILMEIKNPEQPPSKQKLTPDQVLWHDRWRGSTVIIVRTPDEAVRWLAELTGPKVKFVPRRVIEVAVSRRPGEPRPNVVRPLR